MVVQGLFAGAGQALCPGGRMFTYGPFKGSVVCCRMCVMVMTCELLCDHWGVAVDGKCTTASNEEFDASLKSRCEQWGIRDIAECEGVAATHGIRLIDTVSMPANNFTLVWEKQSVVDAGGK